MTRRCLALTASMALVLLSASVAGAQAPAAEARPKSTAAARWTPPKTPWGHPDLQGEWTSDSARGIPRERPQEFAGRTELTDKELAERVARDEQTIKSAVAATGVQTGGRDGFWRGSQTFRQTSLIVDPPDGRMPPVTPEAQKRAASRDRGSFGNGPFDGPEDFTLYDRCITRGIVGGVLPVPYGNGNRILQTPDAFVISYEMIHDTRVIPLDGRPHLGQGLRQYLGDSRGHWEGNTLVIETTNFTDKTSLGANGNGLRHSEAMRMVERLTRTASRRAPVLDHDRRSQDLCQALDAVLADGLAARLPDPSLRMSRGEWRDQIHPGRRTGGRQGHRRRPEGGDRSTAQRAAERYQRGSG